MNDNHYLTELLREKMEDILGLYYYELYDFFLDIITAEYDYKILSARRCLVLYQIFQRLFCLDAESSTDDVRLRSLSSAPGIVMSDQAAAQLSELSENAKVLLVDDVIIHGNHLWNAYCSIISYQPRAAVTPRVYMSSSCPKAPNISDEFWNSLLWTDQSKWGEWMELSNRIVNVIYCANIPYISHLVGYRIDKSFKLNEYCPAGATVLNNTNASQKRMDCISQVLFCERDRYPFFKSVSLLDCVRVFESPYDSELMVTPYSFTKAVRKDACQSLFEKLITYLPDYMPHIKEQLLVQRKDVPTWDLYRLRLFKALVSQIYGVCFFNNGTFAPDKMWTSALTMSFDKKIAREFEIIDYASMGSLLYANDFDYYFCEEFHERDKFVELFEQVRQNPIENRMSDYIHLHRAYEEDRLQERHYKGKRTGISTNYILTASKDVSEMRQIAAQILNLNDSGCATSIYALSEDGKAYAVFLSNGEQSFRILLERYPFIIRKLIFLEEHGLNVLQYLEALFVWWEETSASNNDTQKKSRELLDFYFAHKGKLAEESVVSILDNPDFWDEKETEELQEFNKGYFSMLMR